MTTGGNRKFVVFTSQRTGSTWLIDRLNRQEGIEAHQELFLPRERRSPSTVGRNDYPRFVESACQRESFRPLSVFRYLDGLYHRPGGVGFKLMYSHLRLFPEILAYFGWRHIAVVHLVRRNYLDVIISSELSRQTGRGHSTSPSEAPQPVDLDPTDLLARIGRLERNTRRARRILRLLPCDWIDVTYEDLLNDYREFEQVCRFIAPECRALRSESVLVKRQQRPRSEIIRNYAEVERLLVGSRWASLIES